MVTVPDNNEGESLQAQNARLQKQLEAALGEIAKLRLEATTDALTGIPNAIGFEKKCIDAMKRAEESELFGDNKAWRERRSATSKGHYVAFVDLDNFKLFNDVYGYVVGDQVLISLANILDHWKRKKNDLVARLHGDEFYVLLTGISRRDAAHHLLLNCRRFQDDLRERFPRIPKDEGDGFSFGLGKITSDMSEGEIKDIIHTCACAELHKHKQCKKIKRDHRGLRFRDTLYYDLKRLYRNTKRYFSK